MQIGIIGIGPVGSILAAHLAKSGQSVVLVDILKDHLDAIKNQGLTISGLEQINAQIKDVCYKVPDLKRFTIDYLFICVKAPVLGLILPELKAAISDPPAQVGGKEGRTGKTYVISFQNGLDTEAVIAETVGQDRTLRVVINYAGNFIENGHVKMSFFNKPNYIGGISSKTEPIARQIAQLMTQSGLDTEVAKDIKKYVWEKVVLNSALSPLCALTGQTMKQAMDFPATCHLVEEILKEGLAVAKSIGYEYGDRFLEHCIGYLQKAGYHKTSMRVDIEAKRSTEIDFLNKKIVDYGKKNNAVTPYNETIVNLIKGIEQTY